MKYKEIKNKEDYQSLVEGFCYLVETEIREAEKIASLGSWRDLSACLPRLITMVNLLINLRDNFKTILPFEERGDLQSELYKVEDEFTKRVNVLISSVSADPEGKGGYDYHLETDFAFIKAQPR